MSSLDHDAPVLFEVTKRDDQVSTSYLSCGLSPLNFHENESYKTLLMKVAYLREMATHLTTNKNNYG